jgi:uncharacterized phage-like protein YoqJ
MMRLTVTGHRPDKLRGLDVDTFAMAVFKDQRPPGAEFNIGMAIGWDLACARACAALGIPYRAYVPFVGQELRWSKVDQKRYHEALGKASDVIVVSRVPCKAAYKDRNRAMVDECAGVWALWDGSNGGTSHCVSYALGHGYRVWNYWGSLLVWSESRS